MYIGVLNLNTMSKIEQEVANLKRDFLLAYENPEQGNFNISKTCRFVEITRKTFLEWLEKDPQFQEDFNLSSETVTDDIEESLRQSAVRGNAKSQQFYLQSRARDRGYSKEITITHNQELPAELKNIGNLTEFIESHRDITNELKALEAENE